MPKLTVEGVGTFEVPAGKRLVNALVDECGIDQLHACGGGARCTTCRQYSRLQPSSRATSAKVRHSLLPSSPKRSITTVRSFGVRLD